MPPARWLATVFSKRKGEVFKQLKAFNIAGYYTNDWGATSAIWTQPYIRLASGTPGNIYFWMSLIGSCTYSFIFTFSLVLTNELLPCVVVRYGNNTAII